MQAINDTICIFWFSELESRSGVLQPEVKVLSHNGQKGKTRVDTYAFSEYPMDAWPYFDNMLLGEDRTLYLFSKSADQLYGVSPGGLLQTLPLRPSAINGYPSIAGDAFYYTDINQIEFLKYNLQTKQTETVYTKDQPVTVDLLFKDLRYARFQNGHLLAFVPSFEPNALQDRIFLKDSSGKATLRDAQPANTGGFLRNAIIIAGGMAIFSGLLLLYAGWVRSKKILVKIMIVVVPALFAIGAVIAGVAVSMSEGLIKDSIGNKFYVASSMIAKELSHHVPESGGHEAWVADETVYDKILGLWEESINQLNQMGSIEESNLDFYNSYITVYYLEDDVPYIMVDWSLEPGAQYVASGEKAEYLLGPAFDTFPMELLDATYIERQKDAEQKWMSSYAGIYNGDTNQLLGVVEVGMAQDLINQKVRTTQYAIIVGVALTMTLVVLIVCAIVFNILKGLKKLKAGVDALIDDNWDVTLDITSNDEIEAIGNAFNKMKYRTKKNMELIKNINASCNRFMPFQFFELMGKNNILDVGLGDEATKELTILSICEKNFYTLNKTMSNRECFNFLNKLYRIMADAINTNGGAIESYSNAGLRAIFAPHPQGAMKKVNSCCLGSIRQHEAPVKAALTIWEQLDNLNRSTDTPFICNMVLEKGETMLGIVGDETRLEATLLSAEMNRMKDLEKIAKQNGVKLLMTQNVVDMLDNAQFAWRYMGQVEVFEPSATGTGLYDCLNAYDFEAEEIRTITRDAFEEGVRAFEAADFELARMFFIRVLQADPTDQLAKTYVFLCNEKTQRQ